MHTLKFILAGLMLLGVFLLLGRLWSNQMTALAIASKAFLPVWLLIAVANLWVGVHFAGYSVRDEAPILLIVFVVPAAIAAWVIWRFSHA